MVNTYVFSSTLLKEKDGQQLNFIFLTKAAHYQSTFSPSDFEPTGCNFTYPLKMKILKGQDPLRKLSEVFLRVIDILVKELFMRSYYPNR